MATAQGLQLQQVPLLRDPVCLCWKVVPSCFACNTLAWHGMDGVLWRAGSCTPSGATQGTVHAWLESLCHGRLE